MDTPYLGRVGRLESEEVREEERLTAQLMEDEPSHDSMKRPLPAAGMTMADVTPIQEVEEEQKGSPSPAKYADGRQKPAVF